MTDFKSQGIRLWKRLHASPAGSLPAGSITKVAVVAGTGVILLFLTFYAFLGGGEDATVALPGADVPAQSGGDFTAPLQSNIRQQQQQAEMERQARERDARDAMRDGLSAGQVAELGAEIEAAGPNPDTGLPYTEAEVPVTGGVAPGSDGAADPFATQRSGRPKLPGNRDGSCRRPGTTGRGWSRGGRSPGGGD